MTILHSYQAPRPTLDSHAWCTISTKKAKEQQSPSAFSRLPVLRAQARVAHAPMFTSMGFNVVTVCLGIVQTCGFVEIPVVIPVRRRWSCSNGAATGLTQLGCVAANAREEGRPELKALEFYSGIGGLRMALEKAAETTGVNASVRSYEINDVANSVYEHNFPGCTVTRRSIEHLSSQDVDGAADIWLLSPPCQPFCRIGKQMDEDDNRSVSFLHLLSILKDAVDPPSLLFLENVRGFEGSHVHQRLLEVLTSRGFRVEQYLLSPVHLGIPNTRLRYFCLASRCGVEGEGEVGPTQESLPCFMSMPSVSTQRVPGQKVHVRPLSEFLDQSIVGEAAVPLLLSPKAASYANPSLHFDVATRWSTKTTTFTKGYGKHAGRAGPVLLLTDDGERRVSEEDLGRFPSGLDLGPRGRELRWFSDTEMLRLHGFPERFGFPAGLSLRQRFGLVGNSVNVEVVALLLRRLLLLPAGLERGAL